MDNLLATKYPVRDVCVLVVSVGGNTAAIMQKYATELTRITAFNPEFVILHTGNNELGYHSTKNPNPKDSTQTTAVTLNAAHTIHANHPLATIFLSSAFPRILTRTSLLRYEELMIYNNTVKRYSSRLMTAATGANYQSFRNNIIWKDKKTLRVKTQLFLLDGLHLTDSAKTLVIIDWVDKIKKLVAATQDPA
jgi:hypothetical protein